MLLVTTGCGDSTESEPVRPSTVLRKKIAVPEESKAPPAKVRKAEPVVGAPEAESVQESDVSAKDASKTPGEPRVVKAVAPQPTRGEPRPEAEKAEAPSVPEMAVPASKPEEKATEGKTTKGPEVKPAKGKPTTRQDKALLSPEETVPELSIEQIRKAPRYEYNPIGKLDPFQPLFRTKPEPVVKAEKRFKKKRLPLTPLQKISLGQLRVVGIIVSSAGNKALVEDAAGKGFIVTKGTYIGQNFGQVKEIRKDRIIVEEEVEDILSGKMKPKITELRLHKEAGDV